MINTTKFFDSYYKRAELNCLLIMDLDGTILDVSQSFTDNFGYNNQEIKGQNFSILFTEKDKQINKPRLELENVAVKGQARDENYVVDKNGRAIWCTGESILITQPEGNDCIVKDVVNLQAKKQLQLLLTETEVLLERVFESPAAIPVMILDGSLRILKVNDAFLNFFELTDPVAAGSRLIDIPHPFWSIPEVKDELRRVVINRESIKQSQFVLNTESGESKTVRLNSKIIDSRGADTKIYIMLEEV